LNANKKSAAIAATFTDQEALLFPSQGGPPARSHRHQPMATQRDLSLAISPGSGGADRRDESLATEIHHQGHFVAVITTHRDFWGLRQCGALAAKP